MDLAKLKTALKEEAAALGIDLVGIAPAEPFLAEQVRLEQRRERGHGPNPFEHQEIEPRVYPEMLLPGVKSIIAVGISYLMADPPEGLEDAAADGPAQLNGWLSRYCRGDDYHHVLKDRLTRLAAWLEDQAPGTRTMVHVDTGPPLDRAIAERAGIGKFGKHTNLITPGYGTWVFLGEILTDLPLSPDEPVEAACGSCTLCIDACPTQCITEWNIDANRCLSYITQMKGIIPEEFREPMGNRLFGCDDCQDVCPYNKKARRGVHPEFAPTAEVGPEPSLLQMMAMTKGDFRRWFGTTAAGWRGKTTLQRNALIALANSGRPEAFEPLVAALQSDSAVLRAHAAWGVGRVGRFLPALAASAASALTAAMDREHDSSVLVELKSGLEALSTTQV